MRLKAGLMLWRCCWLSFRAAWRTVGFGVRDAAGAVAHGAGHRKGGLLLEAVGTEHELGVFA